MRLLHAHAHSHEQAPQTQGHTIHGAKFYDVTVLLLTLGQSKKLRAWTIDAAKIRAGETALDVGCGTRALTLLAKRASGATGRVYGIDASPEMIEAARSRASREKLQVEFGTGAREKVDEDLSPRTRLLRLNRSAQRVHRNIIPARICILAMQRLDLDGVRAAA